MLWPYADTALQQLKQFLIYNNQTFPGFRNGITGTKMYKFITDQLPQILSIAQTAAPWLLLGLFLAGMIRALIPEHQMQRWLGGRSIKSVVRAAFIGLPLPMCSCGVIPTALALHRGGAGKGPATAFMIGTPGVGMDSIAITYALLGPFMMFARALGAVITAIATGLLVATTRITGTVSKVQPVYIRTCNDDCADASHDRENAHMIKDPLSVRLRIGMHFAFNELLHDIGLWMLAGLLIAGAVVTFLPPAVLESYGSGIIPMLIMAIAGIPMYICAAAATPLAAAMVIAGISPGTALVFLLAGPITSLATLAVLRREMGISALVAYLGGIVVSAIIIGLTVDQFLQISGIDVTGQISSSKELLPEWLQWGAMVTLIVLYFKPK